MPRNKPSTALPSGVQIPNQASSSVTYNPKKALVAYRAILTEISGVPVGRYKGVVWARGNHEMIVRIPYVRLVFQAGFILVGIPVYCEQTGETEVVVSFAVGRPKLTLGLIMATEDRPRGPAVVVDVWGEPLMALAWQGLVRLAEQITAEAGIDEKQRLPLLPVALSASTEGISILLPEKRSV